MLAKKKKKKRRRSTPRPRHMRGIDYYVILDFLLMYFSALFFFFHSSPLFVFFCVSLVLLFHLKLIYIYTYIYTYIYIYIYVCMFFVFQLVSHLCHVCVCVPLKRTFPSKEFVFVFFSIQHSLEESCSGCPHRKQAVESFAVNLKVRYCQSLFSSLFFFVFSFLLQPYRRVLHDSPSFFFYFFLKLFLTFVVL